MKKQTSRLPVEKIQLSAIILFRLELQVGKPVRLSDFCIQAKSFEGIMPTPQFTF